MPKTFATPAILLCKLKQPYFSVLYTLLPSSFPYISIAINFFFTDTFSWMHPLGLRRVRSTLLLCSQPIATVEVTACSMGSAAKVVTFGGSNVAQCRFVWKAWHLVTFQHVSWHVKNRVWQARYFCEVFNKWIPFLEAGTSVVSCCVFFANRMVRAVSSGDNVQVAWHAWHFVTYVMKNWRKPRTKHRFEVADLGVHEENSQENVDFVPAKCEHLQKSRTKWSFWASYMPRLDSLVLLWLWCREALDASCCVSFANPIVRVASMSFCMAGAVFGDFLTCHSRLGPPHYY